MAGTLTTHVLDTARGTGAAGLRVTLRRLAPDPTEPVETVLDAGGRAVLLSGVLPVGRYEIVFHAGAYQRALGMVLAEPAFLDEVPVRFGVAEPGAHYHVPLILSPFGYSTYRGG